MDDPEGLPYLRYSLEREFVAVFVGGLGIFAVAYDSIIVEIDWKNFPVTELCEGEAVQDAASGFDDSCSAQGPNFEMILLRALF